MRKLALILFISLSVSVFAQRVSIQAVNQPAATVFRSLIEQTGKNFVYSSELLKEMTVSVHAKNKPLKKVLDEIFASTDIEYRISGNNVILTRRKKESKPTPKSAPLMQSPDSITMLDEIVVISRLEAPTVETVEIGAKKITADEVRNSPALFGEPDVIKTLHTLPGVAAGTEGMAGMHVHGGNADENLYMLDNVPLYQVNHFAGLFSAFNTEIIRNIDFFKSSLPAKYDGRLSSFMDVRLQNGNYDRHHGSARLGLTSGSFNITGPIGKNTSYLVGLRRSWYDVLTIPGLTIINSYEDEEKITLNYYFMDLNAKITHRFSNKATGSVSVYFGDDKLRSGSKDKNFNGVFSGRVEDDKYNFHWGNFVAQTNLNYLINPELSAEFTAAYTRFFSSMGHHDLFKDGNQDSYIKMEEQMKTDNNINDWIFRGDFYWQPNDNSRVRFGGNYVRHSFLPARNTRVSVVDDTRLEWGDSTWTYGANELNAYVEDDWSITENMRINAGLHASLFNIERKVHYGISPRLSFSYRPTENVALKAAYSRTIQYVHQLTNTYLSLPTDQWIPITGNFKPQTADKIAIGGYWQFSGNKYAISIEGYYKWMHNLLDYADEYYLKPPMEMWNARLTQGSGTAKGIDFCIEKNYGKLTGHVSYSLSWSDRTFAEKNGGHTFPARFDNRHKINVLVNWNINEKVMLNASWTGHSGNRFTLLPQMWETPPLSVGNFTTGGEAPLRSSINNYQLPFYHRLDLSCSVKNGRGYWTFSLYNAYCHLNTIAIKRSHKEIFEITSIGVIGYSKPVFQKVKLLPIIPSISYTWLF